MAAQVVKRLPEGDYLIYELKFDGYRALVIKDEQRVELRFAGRFGRMKPGASAGGGDCGHTGPGLLFVAAHEHDLFAAANDAAEPGKHLVAAERLRHALEFERGASRRARHERRAVYRRG